MLTVLRPVKPVHASWMSPYLVVRDAQATREFYERALGFKFVFAMPGPNGKPMHTQMTHRDIVVMFSPEDSPRCTKKSPRTSGQEYPIGL